MPRKSERATASDAFQVKQRWGDGALARGFTPVANVFLEHYHRLGIKHGQAMFIIHLMQHKWDEKAPYPSMARIAQRMGLSVVSVRVLARSLEKAGLIERQLRRGATTKFDLNPLLAKLAEIQEVMADTVEPATRVSKSEKGDAGS